MNPDAPIVSISQWQETRSSEKEKATIVNRLRDQALLQYGFQATGDSDGAGTYLTLWQATVPQNSTWCIDAKVVGRGTASGAAYEIAVALQDYGGTLTIISGAPQTYVSLESAAAMDATFAVSGHSVLFKVRDDATQAMTWTVVISALNVR